MSGFGVRVHVDSMDLSNISLGHTWIEVFRPDGTSEQWGYYPISNSGENIPYVPDPAPGELQRDDDRNPDWSSPTYEITEAQYNDIRNYVSYVRLNPGEWIMGWNDCVEFVDQVLEVANLPSIPDLGPVLPGTIPYEWELYKDLYEIRKVIGYDNNIAEKNRFSITLTQAAPLAPTVTPLTMSPPPVVNGRIDVSDGRQWNDEAGYYPTLDLAEYYNNGGSFHGGGGDDYIVGDSDDNHFFGDNDNDELHGGGGSDGLEGGFGNDWLFGEDGNDLLLGGAGVNVLDGGNGDDVLIGSSHDLGYPAVESIDVMYGQDGDDLLMNYLGFATMYGGEGDDTLLTSTGNDYLDGGAGADFINAWVGDDTIYGGDGDDLIRAGKRWTYEPVPENSTDNDYIDGGMGNDTILADDGDDYVNGGDGQDVVVGGLGRDVIYGGAGDDLLFGGYISAAVELYTFYEPPRIVPYVTNPVEGLVIENLPTRNLLGTQHFTTEFLNSSAGALAYDHIPLGIDTVADNKYIDGGSGNDIVIGAMGHDTLDGGEGNDALYGQAGDDGLFGGNGNDAIYAGAGDDVLVGGEGRDALFGGEGADLIIGGADSDLIQGGDNGDIAFGGDGDDLILGEEGADTLYGEAGRDEIQGGIGNDTIFGGDGDDVIFGEDGADTLNGGAGNDEIQGGIGNDIILGGDGDDLTFGGEDADVINGEAGNDVLLGGDGADVLDGGAGNEEIQGGDGNDIIVGGADDDLLFGDQGNDSLSGGAGNDSLVGGTEDDILLGGDGDDRLFGEDGVDVLDGEAGDDEIQGGYGSDLIVGGADNDLLFGDEGNDSLDGGTGNDTLNGGGDNDVLLGGDGDDVLHGSEGEDYLDGGAGNDVLYGGAGDDQLIGGADVDSLNGDEGRDTYTYIDAGGMVSISDTSGVDTLAFAAGATPTGYSTNPISDIVTFSFASGGAVSFNRNEIELIKFATGTLSSVEGWEAGEGESYVGSVSNDNLVGTDRNDILNGDLGDDQLSGSRGDDSLSGGFGNDVLSGGTGYDQLAGGQGNDTYVFELGGGQDVIFNYVAASSSYEGGDAQDVITLTGGYNSIQYPNIDLQGYSGIWIDYLYSVNGVYQPVVELDKLTLGENIAPNAVEFEQEGVDLVLSVVDTTDQVRIKDWFLGNAYQLDGIEFANGRTLAPVDVQGILNSGGRLPDNSAPVGNAPIPYQHFYSGVTSEFWISQFAFSDTDLGDKLTYSATLADGSQLPAWLGFDENPVSFTLTPGAEHEGVYAISIIVTDLEGFSTSSGFNLFITPVNQEIVGTDQYDFLNGGVGDDTITGLKGNDWLWGYEGADTLVGGDGNDYLVGGAYDQGDGFGQNAIYPTLHSPPDGSDVLYGGAGHDLLLGGYGNEYLDGGTGNDNLSGGYGSDTYYFERGYGVDVIADHAHSHASLAFTNAATVDDMDVLRFGAGILSTDINVIVETYEDEWTDEPIIVNISINIEGTADTIIIRNTEGINGMIEQFVFDAGEILSLQDIVALGEPGTVIFSGGGLYPLQHEPAVLLNNPMFMQTAIAGELFQLQLASDQFISRNGTPLEYGDLSLPDWLSFDPETRILSGTPSSQDIGAVTINIHMGQARDSFTLKVEEANHAPILADALDDQLAIEDQTFSYQVPANAFSDADTGDSLQFSARLTDSSALPAWLQFDAETRTFSGAPLNQDVGELEVKVTVIDGRGGVVFDVFGLNVENTNDTPTVATLLASQSAHAGSAFNYAIPDNTFLDVDIGDQLSISASLENGAALPAWLIFDAAEGIISGTPNSQNVGELVIKLTAVDSGGASTSTTLTINVEGVTGEVITGTSGNDTVTGTAGNDVIIGGTGSDTLLGGEGDDTFLIYGTDTGADTFNGGVGYDRVLGGAGDDTVRISNYSGTDTVELIDGGGGVNVIAGTNGGNTIDLSGTVLLNISQIDAGVGYDTVTGAAGNDTIIGGAGSDTLYGNEGNDVLNGGSGNDSLQGGRGNDTYLFARGDGQDIVSDYDYDDAQTSGTTKDRVQFGQEVAADQLWFTRNSNNLKVSIIGTSDSITIENWYSGTHYQVEEFRAADGSMLLQSQVQQLVDAMAAFAPPAAGQLTLQPELQDALAPVIASSWQTAA